MGQLEKAVGSTCGIVSRLWIVLALVRSSIVMVMVMVPAACPCVRQSISPLLLIIRIQFPREATALLLLLPYTACQRNACQISDTGNQEYSLDLSPREREMITSILAAATALADFHLRRPAAITLQDSPLDTIRGDRPW